MLDASFNMRLPGLCRLLCILEVVGVEVTELAILGDLSEIHVGVGVCLVLLRVSIEGELRV